MSQDLRILILDDSPGTPELVERELRRAGLAGSLKCVATEAAFLQALRDSPPQLVLSEYSFPGLDCRRALELTETEQPGLPFICLSGPLAEEQVAELIRLGAWDFVSKQRLDRLGPAVAAGLQEGRRRSERRLAEEFLHDGESRFRAIFDGAGTGIAVEDLSGRILETNRALQEMLGYSAAELQKLTRLDFMPAQDQQEDTQHFRRLLSGELGHYQKERRFVRRDGRIIWGHVTISMIRDPAGRPLFPIILVEDITERQRAEEALVQYAAIVESSNDAIISATFDGIIFSWNPAAERLYGFSAAEANGRSLALIIPAEKEQEWQETLERLRHGERMNDRETLRLRKNGARINVSITTSPIKDAAGRTIGVSSISRDITERKRAEEALRESEENYRRLVELAPDGIFITSQARFVYLNSAACRLFGAESPQELIGTPALERIHPDYRDLVRDRIAQINEGGDVPVQEEKYLRLDGSAVDVEVTAIPFVFRGKPAIQLVVRDVTGRKLAEEALRKSEARLAQAQQIAHLGSWEHDLRFGVLAWSEETCRIFGIEPGTFKGTHEAFEEFVHPDDIPPLRAAAEAALKGGQPYQIDHRIVLDNGEIKTVSEQGEVHFDDQKQPVRFVGTVLDITERKKAENRIAALSVLGHQLSSATTAKAAAEIIVDTADRLFGWDCCSLDLCSPDQQLFTTILCRDLVGGARIDAPPPYQNAPPGQGMRQVLDQGAILVLRRDPHEAADGFDPIGDRSRPSASLMFVPVRNGPRIIGVVSIRSYTLNAYTQDDLHTLQALADHCGGALERIRTEAENQKLAAFPQFNPNPVLEFAGGGTVNYFNGAAQQMARSLDRGHPLEFLPPNVADIVRQCVATGQPSMRNELIVQNRTISSSYFPVPASGVVHCYVSDITERLNLEAQLRQSQKMESVGQLAGGIAHDFNNILTVIQGHTSLLAMAPDLPESAGESAEQIALAADRAANLTRQLLTFSRRQVIQPKSLDLNEVVNTMTKMLRRLLGEDITLQVNYAATLPPVLADPGMMEQIILNLSVNARDAMPRGGRLFVNTSAVEIDAEYLRHTPEARVGGHVCLTVTDTGAGIAPEDLPHIFEPFFTTKDVGKGTGLGLATVYGIVQQHHGWIKVTSSVGRETTFRIFLPAAAVARTGGLAEAREAPAAVRGGKETILVVEDETPLRVLVKNVLERYGYEVLEAGSGVAALSVWRQEKDRIHMLLTDMVMPHGMSGRELADRLHVEKPGLKVIYSSGYSLAVVGADMVLQEGLNFLQKPYHPRKLAQAVRDCLDG